MIFFAVSVPQCLLLFARCKLEKNFATNNFNCVASNADVNYPVILLRCADENTAGPLHLDALFDEHALVDRHASAVWSVVQQMGLPANRRQALRSRGNAG